MSTKKRKAPPVDETENASEQKGRATLSTSVTDAAAAGKAPPAVPEPVDVEEARWYALSDLAAEAQYSAARLMKAQVEPRLSKVLERADAIDLYILNRSIERWESESGPDLDQGGSLVAAIVATAGISLISDAEAVRRLLDRRARRR